MVVTNKVRKAASKPMGKRVSVHWLMLLLCGVLPSTAAAEVFRNSFSGAQWRPEMSVFECRLAQPIPQFGAAIFTRRAGEAQRFVLHTDHRVLAAGDAEIRAENPEWRDILNPEALGMISHTGRDDALSLDWQGSQQLAAQLRQGRRLVFSHRAWSEVNRPLEVVVDPVGFRRGFTAFSNCLDDLLPVNFDQIQRSAVYFPSGFTVLPEEELDTLNRIAQYAAADDKVMRFYVDGHTDGVGLRPENLELSRARAEWVAQYLEDRGVPADRIITRWHGERYPVGANRTAAGRSENRRVTVRLERAEERLTRR